MFYAQVSYSAWKYASTYYEQRNMGDEYRSFGLFTSFGVRLCTLYTKSKDTPTGM